MGLLDVDLHPLAKLLRVIMARTRMSGIRMSPAPSKKHQRINLLIGYELESELRKLNCKQCKVYIPIDWEISADTVVQPDILVECYSKEGLTTPIPVAIFEVLSPSTKNKDRTVKFDLYQAQKVKQYTLLDPENETVEIYTLGPDDLYQKEDSSLNFTYTFGNCNVLLDFRKVWEAA
jgi:Uma2 family endonuclease